MSEYDVFQEEAAEEAPERNLSQIDIRVEQGLLGAILSDSNEGMPMVLETKLENSDFFRPAHGIIYETMKEMYNTNSGVDMLTLTSRLLQKKKLDEVGGASYISELYDQFGMPGNVRTYANLIVERSMLKRLLGVTGHIADLCRSNPPSAAGVLDEAEAEIYKIRDSREANRLEHVSKNMGKVYERIMEMKEKGGITGIPTGFKFLDKQIGGFQKTDLIVIAAKPGIGKTALALTFALNAAIPSIRQDHGNFRACSVAIFSLEMGCEQLLQRLLCQLGRHDLNKLRTGLIDEEELQQMGHNATLLHQSRIFIDDTSGLKPIELRAKARRLQSKLKREGHELDLIVVDYLQLMRPDGKHNNREQEIREVSGALKSLAKELDVPVITLSQLVKGADAADPKLSDLRDSGSIEQDADMVFLLRRKDVGKEKDNPDLKGLAELDVAKHRNGPTGVVRMIYLDYCTTFLPAANMEAFRK
ncbi:MAG: replicative DNA helicase [Deltaproteobacteria bacterium]|jgi:replicative DNA helicase|nr:replicative DNA helicase [Deltaproteobacteria bacterium]